jgi:hypothetical protein
MDRVVNILILLFIIVFDPLAICMVLVFNFLNKPEDLTKENKESIPNDNPSVTITNDPIIVKEMPENPVEIITEQPREQSDIPEPIQSPQPDPIDSLSEEELKIKRAFEMQERRRLKKQRVANQLYSEDTEKTY